MSITFRLSFGIKHLDYKVPLHKKIEPRSPCSRDGRGVTVLVGAVWFQWDCMHMLNASNMDKEQKKPLQKQTGKAAGSQGQL